MDLLDSAERSMADSPVKTKLLSVPGREGNPLPENAPSCSSLRPEDVVHQRDQMIRWWSQSGEWQNRFALQGRQTIPGWSNKGGEREADESRRWILSPDVPGGHWSCTGWSPGDDRSDHHTCSVDPRLPAPTSLCL